MSNVTILCWRFIGHKSVLSIDSLFIEDYKMWCSGFYGNLITCTCYVLLGVEGLKLDIKIKRATFTRGLF